MLINNPKKDLILTDLIDVKTFVNDQECVCLERNRIKGLKDFSVSLIDTFNGFLVVSENPESVESFESYISACEYLNEEVLDKMLEKL